MNNQCSHLIDGKCKNGFPVLSSCHINTGCTPICCNEDLNLICIDPDTGYTHVVKKALEKEGVLK